MKLAGVLLDVCPSLGDHVVDRHLADRAPKRDLGGRGQHAVGVLDVEDVGGRVLDLVLDEEAHLDDVLVLGEHQRLLEDAPAGLGLRRRRRRAEADLGSADALDVDDVQLLDRPGQTVADARAGRGGVPAERPDHAVLTRLDRRRRRTRARVRAPRRGRAARPHLSNPGSCGTRPRRARRTRPRACGLSLSTSNLHAR